MNGYLHRFMKLKNVHAVSIAYTPLHWYSPSKGLEKIGENDIEHIVQHCIWMIKFPKRIYCMHQFQNARRKGWTS